MKSARSRSFPGVEALDLFFRKASACGRPRRRDDTDRQRGRLVCLPRRSKSFAQRSWRWCGRGPLLGHCAGDALAHMGAELGIGLQVHGDCARHRGRLAQLL